MAEERIDGIRYVWVRTPSYHGNGFARAVNIFAFVAVLSLRQGEALGTNLPDVVIASSTYPLDFVAARRVAARAGAKVIYEVHDLWPLSLIELGNMSRWHPFIVLMQWAENYACRRADGIVSLLPKAEPHLRQHGMPEGHFTYIPNGIVVEEWQNHKAPVSLPDEHRGALAALQKTGSFLIGYAGAHGVANSLHIVVEAARLLRDKPICFVLVGKGPEKESLQQRARQQGLLNMVFLPPVPKSSVPQLLSALDALYIGLPRRPVFRFGISPNKLMDYMMAGKPLIQGIEAGNDLVAESGCGLSIAPESPGALAGAAMQIMTWSPSERDQAGRRGREYVLRHHDYRALARHFLDRIASLGQPAADLGQATLPPMPA
jgi:glycosyltransferase involved in cell wall biosynthesis